MKNVNILKYDYMIALFKAQQNDPKIAVEICQMLSEGLLKVAPSTKDDKLLFLMSSRYRSKCIKCGEYYAFGDPIFCKNRKGWHVRCADDEDLENPFFKDCLDKGLIEEEDKKKKN